MMLFLKVLGSGLMLLGIYMSVVYPENKKQRSYGCLMATIAILLWDIAFFCEGSVVMALIYALFLGIDWYVYRNTWDRYKRTQMDEREKFLKRLTESRRLW